MEFYLMSFDIYKYPICFNFSIETFPILSFSILKQATNFIADVFYPDFLFIRLFLLDFYSIIHIFSTILTYFIGINLSTKF
jgi:hypothetical protein